MTEVTPIFPMFFGLDGSPLEDGQIYVGVRGLDAQTNPKAVYWDAAQTIPAAQPIRTLSGYPARDGSPAQVFTDAGYSMTVLKKTGVTIYSSLDVTNGDGFQSFKTNAQMVASASLSVGDTVQAEGGNRYEIVAASTFVADGVTVINLTGIAGQAVSTSLDQSVVATTDPRSLAFLAATYGTSGTVRATYDGHAYALDMSQSLTPYMETAGGVRLQPIPRDGEITASQCGIATTGDQTADIQKWAQWAADQGYTLAFDGDYEFSRLEFASGDLKWRLDGATLRSNKTARDGAGFDDDRAIYVTNPATETVALTADFIVGDRAVSLGSTAGIVAGDFLQLKSTRLIPSDNRGDWREGQLCKVASVVGSVAILDAPLLYSGKASNITTGTITTVDGPRILTLSAVPAGFKRDRVILLRITGGADAGQSRMITSISGNQVTISDDRDVWPDGVVPGVSYSYEWITTADVIKPRVVSITGSGKIYRDPVYADASGGFSYRGIEVVGADSTLDGVDVSGFAETNLLVRSSYAPRIRNCNISAANRVLTVSNGTGYGVSFDVCHDAQVSDVVFRECRRGVDFSGSTGYSTMGLCHNLTGYGGGTAYDGAALFPQGAGRQSLCGSHGSGLLTEYRNCKGIDIYGGVNMRGVREIVRSYTGIGSGYQCVQIFLGASGSRVDGVFYDDALTEVTRIDTGRQMTGSPALRMNRLVTYEITEDYADNLLTQISNLRGGALVYGAVAIEGGSGSTVRNLTVTDVDVTCSPEGTSETDFRTVRCWNDAQLAECSFRNLRHRQILAYSGNTANISLVLDTGASDDNFDGEPGAVSWLDNKALVKVANGAVLRINAPSNAPMMMLTMENLRTGATRPRAYNLAIETMTTDQRNSGGVLANAEIKAGYFSDVSTITSGNVGINWNAATGKLSLGNNSGADQTLLVSLT